MVDLGEGISERANRFKGCYVPVFKADCDERPYHAGTMTSVAFPGFHALVTAAHVLQRDESNDCDEVNQIYVFSKGLIKQIQRMRTATLPIPGGSLDLSVILTEDVSALDVFAEPIRSSSLWRSRITSGIYMVACGFPRTRNRRKGRDLSFRPYGYFGAIAEDFITERAGYDPRFHFSIEIDLKRVFRDDQKSVRAPNPDGISGGPVFLVHDFSTSALVEPALVGIVIAKDSKGKHLICIRVEFIEHIALELHRTPIAELHDASRASSQQNVLLDPQGAGSTQRAKE